MILLPLSLALSTLAVAAPCACTCFGPGPLDRAVAHAAAVFVGRVTRITWERDGLRAQVRLRVDRAWKWPGSDPRPPKEMVVETARGPACGAYFVEGEEWLVFASLTEDKHALWTGQCTGTDRLNQRGTEPWQRQLRQQVRERLEWLERHLGRGARPVR